MVVYHVTDCHWLPANHFLFQLANICLVFSYLVPDNLNGLFLLRFWLGSGGLFFALWGWLILCAPDTFGWNLAFMFVNYAHFLYLLIKVKRPRKFSHDCELAYMKLFEPLGVQRFQFQLLADKAIALELAEGQCYAKEDNIADKISILMSGSVEVTKENKILHIMKPFEFLDSPEWAVSMEGESAKFGVSLIVREDIQCLSWNSKELKKIFKKDKFLKTVFDSLIGQDVTKKLLNVSGNMADLQTKELQPYLTGSIVYMHTTGTEVALSPKPQAHHGNNIHHQSPDEIFYSHTSYNETIGFLDSTPGPPQTPTRDIDKHIRRAIATTLPISWQENTPIIASDGSDDDSLKKETVL